MINGAFRAASFFAILAVRMNFLLRVVVAKRDSGGGGRRSGWRRLARPDLQSFVNRDKLVMGGDFRIRVGLLATEAEELITILAKFPCFILMASFTHDVVWVEIISASANRCRRSEETGGERIGWKISA